MSEPPTRDPHHDPRDSRPEDASPDRSRDAAEETAVRQDDALTRAERLPRRGDHEIPPGNDSSV